VEETITGRGRQWKALGEPHRRLVCFCRLTEVDGAKKRRPGKGQRGVFVFNDVAVVTKTVAGKRRTQHQFRSIVDLSSTRINVFSTSDVRWGVELQAKGGGSISSGSGALVFEARSQTDQERLVADLQESAAEAAETEKARMLLVQERQEQQRLEQRERQLQHQKQLQQKQLELQHQQQLQQKQLQLQQQQQLIHQQQYGMPVPPLALAPESYC